MVDAAVVKACPDVIGCLTGLLDTVGIPDLTGKTVLLKPNMGRIAHNESGIITSREVILAAADYFLAKHPGRLILGDSPITGYSSLDVFETAGITESILPEGVELVDFDKDKPVDVEVPHGEFISSIKVCAPVMEADYIVSIPVMKTHMHTVVSLGLKNMKGCLYRKEKVRFHQLEGESRSGDKSLDVAIADLATALLPDLTIVDGTVGMQGFGPSSGETVKPGLLVAGRNCISTDAVTASLMGFDPQSIPILRISSERGLGEIRTDMLDTEPADLSQFIFPFERAPFSINIKYDGIFVYDKGACSACLSTVLLFLQRYEQEVREIFGNDDEIHIYIGDTNDVVEHENNILIGRCTRKDREKGIYVPGCPPVASYILEKIKENLS